MSLKINFTSSNSRDNCVFFCDNEFKIEGLNIGFKKNNVSIIKKFVNRESIRKNKIICFDFTPIQKIIIILIEKNISRLECEKLGAQFYEFLNKNSIKKIFFNEQNIKFFLKIKDNFISEFINGAKYRSYKFEKYKSNIKINQVNFNIPKNLKKTIQKYNRYYSALLNGLNFTKDLVSEPGNILHPDEYVKRIQSLKKLGLKIKVYNKQRLKEMNMNALLGVGKGSSRGSYLVVIEWNGSLKKKTPLAFVGKGVCFDTGGISLKPAKFMEDMTYDMAGSAVVVGLMKTLALRKAKVNAVGVVGLVENMPDGNAQRPGDIVKSYSGKTIEILNTDAEGRLVLADALTYTEKKYKPKFIVDLATLTGAIIVSLGSEYAGLFSNDDKISDQLSKAGEKVGEKVWRMPLNENYDKLINSKKADMQNINYVGGAGSTTAAQFLQRFILNKTPWAHLDIAGMAFSKYGGAINSGGATGYGVRLLNQLIEDNYE